MSNPRAPGRSMLQERRIHVARAPRHCLLQDSPIGCSTSAGRWSFEGGDMTPVQGALVAAILVGLLGGLVYAGRPFWGWVLALAGALTAWAAGGVASPPLFAAALGLWLAATAVFGLPALRQRLVTRW